MEQPAMQVLDLTEFDAVVLDLDGVLTQTARVHAAAWKEVLDAFLLRHGGRAGQVFPPFDVDEDYRRYVDGRPRLEGIGTFLAARGIALPDGDDGDDGARDTVRGLGDRKNARFLELLARDGVSVFEDALAFLRTVRGAGLRTAVVSASRNTRHVLAAAGLADMFDARIDGIDAARLGLPGKPHPDTFLRAVHDLGVAPERAIGVEDALAGVAALRAGGFGSVIGVDRTGDGVDLIAAGAGVVVRDLSAMALRMTPRDWPALRACDGLETTPADDAGWTVVEDGFSPEREATAESLFALANGLVGSRGSLAEGNPHAQPCTVLAGMFDAPADAPPGFMAVPDWTAMPVWVEGVRLVLDDYSYLAHRRVLDMRQGILWRCWWYREASGHLGLISELRLASGGDRHVLVQSVAFAPAGRDWSVSVDADARETWCGQGGRGTGAAMATATWWRETHTELSSSFLLTGMDIPVGQLRHLDRVVTACTSHDFATPDIAAQARLRDALARGLPALVAEHCRAWDTRWRMCDIRIDGDPDAQRAIRFAMFHLMSSVNPDDERVSIGARLLTGNGYRGHVFWDTEIFMLPFFALTWPAAARSLLMYRYHTLPAARARAAGLGYRGALYAWESADSGDDVTPAQATGKDGTVVPILTGPQEQHISADVAHGVWTYWRATGDAGFLRDAGVEILAETARFWASRAARDADGSWHIRGVIGPDEYHETVDDNAYTNGMARWNLRTAAQVAGMMAKRWPAQWRALEARIGLGDEEVAGWLRVAEGLYTGLDPGSGLIEQFQGYFALEDIDLAGMTPRDVPPDVVLGPERVRGSQIIKQADVVMLLCLLWDDYPHEVISANFCYYEKRCGQGSSLSPAIHALMAARLGEMEMAARYFRQAMAIDLGNSMGNDAGGVHGAALGGLWQAVVLGFGGLRMTDSGPEHRVALPPGWQGLSFHVQWHGAVHEVCHKV